MKSPRSPTHGLVARAIDQIEDGIYIVVAVLLVVAGLFALWGTVTKLVSDVQQHFQAVSIVTDLLDNGLILSSSRSCSIPFESPSRNVRSWSNPFSSLR